jgi:hypothetical protein
MNYAEAIAYLTRCADDTGAHWHGGRQYPPADCPTCHGTNNAGHLTAPGSRYGRTAADIAPYVYRVARAKRNTSESMLDHLMRMAVNDSETPQRWLRQYAQALSGADIDDMVTGYLDAQLWAQQDMDRDDDSLLDAHYSRDDIAPEYVESVREEFVALVTEHPLAVRMYGAQRQYHSSDGSVWEHFGHDYYLTREHHGVGFWGRGLGELGDYLTDIAYYAGSANDLFDNGSGVLVG